MTRLCVRVVLLSLRLQRMKKQYCGRRDRLRWMIYKWFWTLLTLFNLIDIIMLLSIDGGHWCWEEANRTSGKAQAAKGEQPTLAHHGADKYMDAHNVFQEERLQQIQESQQLVSFLGACLLVEVTDGEILTIVRQALADMPSVGPLSQLLSKPIVRMRAQCLPSPLPLLRLPLILPETRLATEVSVSSSSSLSSSAAIASDQPASSTPAVTTTVDCGSSSSSGEVTASAPDSGSSSKILS